VAKYVIIDWQKDSLIIGSGTRRGGGIVFDQLRQLPLGESENGNISASQALRKAAQEMGLGKAEAIVLASRENVEVRTLLVPNVDADELPDIIRFQAQRQMANMGESWPLDFILLPSAGLENKVALAAAVSPAHMAEIEGAVNAAGLHLTNVLLRPIEIARFALAADTSGRMKEGASVILCLTDQQSDLLLLSSGAVVQLRSTRLPSDPSQVASTLVGEIKRSLVAASSQLNGQSLSSALLIAPAELAANVESAIENSIGCNVSVVDPMVMLPAGNPEAEQLTHTASNRLAAIAGVIGNPSPDRRTLIDFKNPKKRTPKEANTRRYAMAGAIAAIVALGGGYWLYSTHAAMDQELATLKREIADKKPMADLARKQIADFNAVKKVLDASPNWLAELETIALNKPSSDKVILFNPQMTVTATGDALIKTKAFGVSPSLISEFESQLRADEKFKVTDTGNLNTEDWKEYPWETMVSIVASNRGWKLLESPGKGNAPAASVPKTPDAKAAGANSNEVKAKDAEAHEESPLPVEDKSKPAIEATKAPAQT
jgi:Tfp pilus assembly PilM family ATPase